MDTVAKVQVPCLTFTQADPRAQAPVKMYYSDAGYDLFCLEDITLEHLIPTRIETGLTVEFSAEYVMLIQERSSAFLKHGIVTHGNVIDAGYKGKIGILAINFGAARVIKAGDRIAQALLIPVYRGNAVGVSAFSMSDRGKQGTGSTGL